MRKMKMRFRPLFSDVTEAEKYNRMMTDARNMKQTIAELQSTFHGTGRVEWLGVRPERRADMVSLQREILVPGKGLLSDRFKGSEKSRRQVSLIQAEHIAAMAQMSGRAHISPAILRRNIVISGINLLALKNCQFRLGEAILEMTCLCHPCSRMEEALGPGGFNLMRGHGGILARVLVEGPVAVGDTLAFLASGK